MSGSNLTEGGGNTPPTSAALGGKRPALLGLSDKAIMALFFKIIEFLF